MVAGAGLAAVALAAYWQRKATVLAAANLYWSAQVQELRAGVSSPAEEAAPRAEQAAPLDTRRWTDIRPPGTRDTETAMIDRENRVIMTVWQWRAREREQAAARSAEARSVGTTDAAEGKLYKTLFGGEEGSRTTARCRNG